MQTVKLSHTILSQWSEGKFEEAIGQYLGKPFPSTPAMELGSLKHQLWDMYIRQNKALPLELGGGKLAKPITEQKYQKFLPFSDDIQILIRGVIDCSDGTDLYDFKCGLTPANAYVDKLQLDYYKLLLPEVTTGIYLCFNPYSESYTKAIKFLDDSNADNALNHIMTYGGEFIDYLQVNKLLKDFKE